MDKREDKEVLILKQCCNFPRYENNALLSLQDKYNYFLATNTGVSLLGEFEDFSVKSEYLYISFGWTEFLPMGYTNIHLYERQEIICAGSTLWKNSSPRKPFRDAGKYLILDSGCNFRPETFVELEDAVCYLRQLSADNVQKYLIVRHLGSNVWH